MSAPELKSPVGLADPTAEKRAIVLELDDLCDRWDCRDQLLALKERIPELRATLFAIPRLCSPDLIAFYRDLEWVELAVHGWTHALAECCDWGPLEAEQKLRWGAERLGGARGFRAPSWLTSQSTYQVLDKLGMWVADHPQHSADWGAHDIPRFLSELHDDLVVVHGHTHEVDNDVGIANGPSFWVPAVEQAVAANPGLPFRLVGDEVARGRTVDVEQERSIKWNHKTPWGMKVGRELVAMYEHLGLNGERVLDVGGNDGTGAVLLRRVQEAADVWVLDSSPACVWHARQTMGVPARLGKAEALPFPTNSFDWVFTSHTMEHVVELERALLEMRRVARHGAWFVLPCETADIAARDPAHRRNLSHEEWLAVLDAVEVKRTPVELTCMARWSG